MTSPPGIHSLPTAFGSCYVLAEAGRAIVIDSGLFGMRPRFEALFAALDLRPHAVDAIVLTHGHLDHTCNAAWLRDWTGAPIHAHPAEQHHLDGTHPYHGSTRLLGWLEAIGRRIAHYRPVKIDRPLADGDLLPWWGGLRVIHLPGHTAGHCGLWSERHKLLFCGDLVAIWRWHTVWPPFFFNSEPEKLRDSLRRAAALRPRFVMPNHHAHFGPQDPEYFAARFRQFAERKLR